MKDVCNQQLEKVSPKKKGVVGYLRLERGNQIFTLNLLAFDYLCEVDLAVVTGIQRLLVDTGATYDPQ